MGRGSLSGLEVFFRGLAAAGSIRRTVAPSPSRANMQNEKITAWLTFLLCFGLAPAPSGAAPKNVLHYAKVGYFNHVGGIIGGTTALNTLAQQYKFTVKHSTDPNDLLNLKNYDLVIFDNNTDAGGVTNTITGPQQALMDYMNNGGKYLGFHGSSDHRDQWTWYDSALYSGAKFVSHGGGAFNMFTDTSSDTKKDAALGRMWAYCKDSLKIANDVINFNTEIYQFDIDVRGKPNVQIIQELRGATAQNGVRQSFTWLKTMPKGGGKMLYSSMGHETAEWTANNAWLTKATWAFMKYLVGDFDATTSLAHPGIRTGGSHVEIETAGNHAVEIRDLHGRLVASGTGSPSSGFKLKQGIYFVTVATPGSTLSKRVLIQ
jgi:type 1 glutamine amidotransferase